MMGVYVRKQNGLILAAASSLVFATCTLIAKYLSKFHPSQLSFYGFFGILIVSSYEVAQRRERLFPRGVYKLILIKSVCGCIFLISSFYAVQLMPLGDASVLFYTAPVWTLILARWFLNEPCNFCSVIIVIIVTFGVILVTQPSIIFKNEDNKKMEYYTEGAAAALFASISEAVGNIALRELKNVPPSVILFNYGLVSTVLSGITSVALDGWTLLPKQNEISLIIVLSGLTVFEQFLMTLALSLEHAGPVALVQASDIIYGYIFEVIFYGEEVNIISMTGAIVVGIMVVYMALRHTSTPSPSIV